MTIACLYCRWQRAKHEYSTNSSWNFGFGELITALYGKFWTKKTLVLFIEWRIFRAYFFRQDQHRPILFACTEQVDFAHKPTIGRNSSTINFKSFRSTRDVIKVTLKLIKDSVDSDSLYFQSNNLIYWVELSATLGHSSLVLYGNYR